MPRIKPEEFAATVNKYLEEYAKDVDETMAKVVTETALEAEQQLHSAGDFNGTKYKRSWDTQINRKRLYIEARVYNKKGQLTHLLEHGHVIARGGRIVGEAGAFKHIEPINDEAQKKVEEELIKK
jgi:hypothetical protein